MKVNRREFSSSILASGPLAALPKTRSDCKAVLFDAFALLDPRPVFALAENLFPGRGDDLATVWRDRQFEYCWLRALSQRYADFWHITEDALVFAAKKLQLELRSDQRVQLMHAYLAIQCWPDTPDALRALRTDGLRLAFLSNMTEKMLQAGIKTSGFDGLFEHVLSTDQVRAFKPDGRAYQMGIDAFGLRREEILFVAFAGWDAAGAQSFGFPTFWLNRQQQPAEELGIFADYSGTTLNDVVRLFVRGPKL